MESHADIFLRNKQANVIIILYYQWHLISGLPILNHRQATILNVLYPGLLQLTEFNSVTTYPYQHTITATIRSFLTHNKVPGKDYSTPKSIFLTRKNKISGRFLLSGVISRGGHPIPRKGDRAPSYKHNYMIAILLYTSTKGFSI
jgi:hypothetical protein